LFHTVFPNCGRPIICFNRNKNAVVIRFYAGAVGAKEYDEDAIMSRNDGASTDCACNVVFIRAKITDSM